VHRDQKIGLSLAVLLIGFAGAFCFRHEPILHPAPLALDRADELDLRIEHLPIRAYTEREGVRLPGETDRDRQRVAADGPLSDVIERPLTGTTSDAADSGNVIDLFAGPPEPLRVAEAPDRPTVTSPLPAPSQPRDFTERSDHTGPTVSPTLPGTSIDDDAPVTAATPTVTYVVRPGETLSELSLRFLGSTARYRELFDANRDVLANPDVLPAGTLLQVPANTQ